MITKLILENDGAAADGSRIVRALLRVHGATPAGGGRIPLNLSLVLDRSGSMAGEKLAAARDAAVQVVRRLWPEDRVSVVAFDDQVRVVAPPSRGAEAPDLTTRIAAIEAGGSTNLSGAWLKARELTAAWRADGVLSRIVLLTDGRANMGIVDAPTLSGLCAHAAQTGVTTTTVGFGEGFDERLLRALADAGGGNAYYVERADQAVSIFEEELAGLLSLTAQNLTVEVRPAAGARLVAVHHSYPSREAGGVLHLELGDVYAREPRTLLVEFAASAGTVAADVQLGTLVLRADVLLAGGGVERREITCPIELPAGEPPRTEPEVRRELLLAATARARDEALARESRGDHEGAAGVLQRVAAAIRAHGHQGDERLTDELADLETSAGRFARQEVTGEDRKYQYQRSYESARGRAEAWRRVKRE